MNESKSALKNIVFVAFSNFVKLLSSIAVGLLIPDILGVTNNGYYTTFVLYLTYIGVFHFGFIDGIYLKFAGKDYSELEKSKFRLFTNFLLKIELAVSILILLIAIFFIQGDKQMIFSLLAINLISVNLTTYFQYISQVTKRFKEFSLRSIIQGIISIVIVAIMYISNSDDPLFYIIMIIVGNYILLGWYMYTYRDIIFGKREPYKTNTKELLGFFTIGMPLLLANLISTLILTVGKQVVEIGFSVDVFSVYSFGYTMLGFISIFVAAISTVIYPYMSNVNNKQITKYYSHMIAAILIIVSLGCACYFPLYIVVEYFLPDYFDAMIIFRIVLPTFILTSAISTVKHNFMKATGKNHIFFSIGVSILAITILFAVLAYFFFGTTLAVTIGTTLAIVVWYVITEIYFVVNYKIKYARNSLFLVLAATLFLLSTSLQNVIIGCAIYLVILGLIVYIMYGKDIKSVIKNRTKIAKNNEV